MRENFMETGDRSTLKGPWEGARGTNRGSSQPSREHAGCAERTTRSGFGLGVLPVVLQERGFVHPGCLRVLPDIAGVVDPAGKLVISPFLDCTEEVHPNLGAVPDFFQSNAPAAAQVCKL